MQFSEDVWEIKFWILSQSQWIQFHYFQAFKAQYCEVEVCCESCECCKSCESLECSKSCVCCKSCECCKYCEMLRNDAKCWENCENRESQEMSENCGKNQCPE